MQETFRPAENYSTSFSGNTLFHAVSEYCPRTPVTANALNARDFFHHRGSKIKKLESRRTNSVSLEHRDLSSTPSLGMDSRPCCVVME